MSNSVLLTNLLLLLGVGGDDDDNHHYDNHYHYCQLQYKMAGLCKLSKSDNRTVSHIEGGSISTGA